MKRGLASLSIVVGVLFLLAGCGPGELKVLRLATTTSLYDSGLLAEVLPQFEAERRVRIDVLAVGTGQAIALGERGDVDLLMVHDPHKEEAFIKAGHGLWRKTVMYNDFVLLGPKEDQDRWQGEQLAAEALRIIAKEQLPFVSRGDQSGTHGREQDLWESAGIEPDPGSNWYYSIGQGMGETLQFADELGAYTLSDRGTYLATRSNLPGLIIAVGGSDLEHNPDPALMNYYSVIPLNPDRHAGLETRLAEEFAEWLTSSEIQEQIAQFGRSTFNQPLFYPCNKSCSTAKD